MAKKRKSINAIYEKKESYVLRNEKERSLVKALCGITKEEDMTALLRDLLSPAEIAEFANRVEIARLICKGLSYKEIAKECDVSTTTVSRVAHWLYNGCGGYNKLLNT